MKTIMMYCNKNNNNLYLKRRWSSVRACVCVCVRGVCTRIYYMGLMAIRAQLVTQGTDRQYNEKTVWSKMETAQKKTRTNWPLVENRNAHTLAYTYFPLHSATPFVFRFFPFRAHHHHHHHHRTAEKQNPKYAETNRS